MAKEGAGSKEPLGIDLEQLKQLYFEQIKTAHGSSLAKVYSMRATMAEKLAAINRASEDWVYFIDRVSVFDFK